MKQNQAKNSLNITRETKPGKKPTKMTVCLHNTVFLGRALSIWTFSLDAHYGLIVSLRGRPLSLHVSYLNQSESEKIKWWTIKPNLRKQKNQPDSCISNKTRHTLAFPSIFNITWNFRDIFISWFRGLHISRHLNFTILRKFSILNHF